MSRAGEARAQTGRAPQATATAAAAGHAIAHRWQPAPLVSGRALVGLAVLPDGATSQIYYAQLVEEKSTRTVMAALREVIERQGVFCVLYSDRASHFWHTLMG